jgi:hypothetical protein
MLPRLAPRMLIGGLNLVETPYEKTFLG